MTDDLFREPLQPANVRSDFRKLAAAPTPTVTQSDGNRQHATSVSNNPFLECSVLQ